MVDEFTMPPGERAAYANGWHAREAEIEVLKQEIERLWTEVRRLRASYDQQTIIRKRLLDWSPEEENSLRDLAAKGLTLVGIANALVEEFGKPRSRNAVVSKLKRDGIPHAWKQVEQKPKRKRKSRAKPKPVPPPLSSMLTIATASVESSESSESSELVEPPSSSSPLPPDAPAGAVHFMDRRPDQCAYPLWDQGYRIGFVCGQPVKAESLFRFCEDHLAVVLRR